MPPRIYLTSFRPAEGGAGRDQARYHQALAAAMRQAARPLEIRELGVIAELRPDGSGPVPARASRRDVDVEVASRAVTVSDDDQVRYGDWEAMVLSEAVADAQGFLLPGGPDVLPAFYGALPEPHGSEDSRPQLDDLEIQIAHAARQRETPLLAICRGAQIVGVAHGQQLIQDTPTALPDTQSHRGNTAHRVQFLPGRLSEWFGLTASVCCSHHQAIQVLPGQTLSHGLRVSAWSEDGLLEGYEFPPDRHPFYVAVQFHPERHAQHQDLDDAGRQGAPRLFQGFLEACSNT